MKKWLSYLLLLTVIIFCSSNTTEQNLVNMNSWSISIGKKDLLASWKNQEMGDTAVIARKKLKLTDTLYAQRYLCGYSGTKSITTMIIKDHQNKMPVSEIFDATESGKGEIFSVFFSIESKSREINQTVLLGRLRFK